MRARRALFERGDKLANTVSLFVCDFAAPRQREGDGGLIYHREPSIIGNAKARHSPFSISFPLVSLAISTPFRANTFDFHGSVAPTRGHNPWNDTWRETMRRTMARVDTMLSLKIPCLLPKSFGASSSRSRSRLLIVVIPSHFWRASE